jgi:hypothetical protein
MSPLRLWSAKPQAKRVACMCALMTSPRNAGSEAHKEWERGRTRGLKVVRERHAPHDRVDGGTVRDLQFGSPTG